MPATLTTISQKKRFIAIDTPLGKDVLGLVSLSAREELGRLFQFDVEMISENFNINFDDIIGRNVTIRLETGRAGTRYFNGYVSTFHQTAVQRRFARYQATIVPWLWLLTRKSDCRIYQNQTVPQIIQDVFKRSRVAQLELRLSGKYQPWEYCVQYRETDFNFVSRLMEQEGIYYFFKHQKGKHTLVLCDSPGAHEKCPGYGEVKFRPEGDRITVGEYILDWSLGHELRTTRFAQTDYDFKVPTKPLQTQAKTNRKHAFNAFEIYDYPGEYTEHNHGQTDSKVRIQELQCRQRLAHGHADARGLLAGHTFTLQEHPRRDQCRSPHLILSAHLTARTGGYESEGRNGDSGDSDSFHCDLTVMEAKEYFRPERLTPKPVVQGIHSAVVTGPKGKEVYLDDHSRVKVHFHWDRHDKRDENSSCWIRVSQPWAGGTYGGLCFPRIGQEVLVDFLEGDPDQPLITGRVYNGGQMPPPSNAGRQDSQVRASREWAKTKKQKATQTKQEREARKDAIQPVTPTSGSSPPTPPPPVKINKSASMLDGLQKVMSVLPPNPFNTPPTSVVQTFMMSSIKSNSLDGASGFNEITMNDAGGKEGLFVNAQKDNINNVNNDRETTIGRDELVKIGNDRTEMVGNDEHIEIGNDRSEHVGNDEHIDIRNDRHETVGNNEDIEIGNDRTEHVKNDEKITVGHDRIEKVGNDENIAITGNRTEKVGKDENIEVTGNRTEKVGEDERVTIAGKRVSKIGKDFHSQVGGEAVSAIAKDSYASVGGNVVEEFQKNHAQSVGQEYWLGAQRIVLKADQEICLLVGGNFISISPSGVIIEGTMVNINCGNAPSPSDPPPGSQCKAPEDP